MLSFGKISITVSKANLTHDVCTFFTMDPYFMAYMQEKKNYAYISQVKKKAGKYPIWNETLTFDNFGEKCLVFEILHEKELIGKAEIPLVEIITRVSYTTQYALYKGTKITGQICVNIEYTPNQVNSNQGVQVNGGNTNVTNKIISNLNEGLSGQKVNNSNINQNLVNAPTSQNEMLKRSSGLDNGFSPVIPNQNSFMGYQSMNSSEFKNNVEGNNNFNLNTPPTSSQIPLNIYNNNLNPVPGQFNNPNTYGSQFYGSFPQMNQQVQNQNFNKQNSIGPDGYLNPMISYNQMGGFTNHNLMGAPQVNTTPYNNQFNYLNQLNSQPNFNQNGPSPLINPPQVIDQTVSNQPINPNNNQNITNQLNNQISNNQFVNNELNNQMFSSHQPDLLKSRNSSGNITSTPIDNSSQQGSIYFNTLNYFKYPLFFQHNSKNIWSYDIVNSAWKQVNNPSQEFFGKYHRAAELPDGSYFLTGGEVNGQTVNTVRHFINGFFTQKQNMIFQRKAHCVVYSGGFVFIFGGFGTSGVMKTCEKFDLMKGTWTTIANMNYPRGYGTGVVYGENFIFLIGGFIGDKLDGVKYLLISFLNFQIVCRK
jgi:hypothetical protein